ncbi:TPA: hypothetical protein MYP09_001388 [Citrobacter farmeri]|nr:hypothetical protein [Citrobacter farmeri]
MNNIQEKQLEIAVMHAKSKGGLCLSEEYVNKNGKLKWKCSNPEHSIWESSFRCVVSMNCWCRKCSSEKQSIERRNKDGLQLAKVYAESKGGFCLSTEYENRKVQLEWKCANPEHKPWFATYANVVSEKNWCNECRLMNHPKNQRKKDGLEIAINHAKLKNGECLSAEYLGRASKMQWKCANSEHKSWFAAYGDVIGKGTWCPECSSTRIGERRVRLVFEAFFGKKFPCEKPSWNVNPWTNKRLELDGYCKEFNIAFEFDGEHHFELINYSGHKPTKNELTYQKFRDEQKRKNCRRQSITLVNVPILVRSQMAKFEPFVNNIIESCKKHGIEMYFSKNELSRLEKEFFLIQ